jgi:hypothetical protein
VLEHLPGHPTAHRIDSVGISGIACPSQVECVAIDHLGCEVAFDSAVAASPKAYQVDPGHELASISCPASNQCTAVDREGREVTFNPQDGRTISRLQIAIPPGSRASPAHRAPSA